MSEKHRNLPLPMFWMPYKLRVTEGEEKQETMAEKDTSKKIHGESKVPLHIINVQPEKHTDNNEKKPERNVSNEEGAKVPNTNRVVKTIPVKQLKEQVEEDKKASSKIKEIEKKPLEESAKKQSSSPPKASKLPPVCLRVEPLPKRKGANGNSRSPSPPGDKRKTDVVSGTESANSKTKEGRENHQEIEGDRSNVAEKRSTSLEKATEAANESFRQGEVKLGFKTGDNVSHDNTMKKDNAERSVDSRADQSVDSDDGRKGKDLEAKIKAAEDLSLTAKDSSEEAEESKKVKFSDAEAATMIQAAYRGFEVRKSEPLKKLKKLAEVKGEVTGIRGRIQALESPCNVEDYDKEKIVIMEMIMNLLLKLDAIQGLHESIRAFRKSIAKELVSLQETLDALIIMEKSSPALQEQPSGASSEETLTLFDPRNEDSNIELQNKDIMLEQHDLSKIDNKVSQPEEQCEKQQVLETDTLPTSKDSERSVAMVTRESLADELKDVSGGTSAEFLHGATDSTSIVGGNDKEHDDVQSLMVDSSRDVEELEIRELFETQEPCRDMSNADDVSEDMGKEISNILPLELHNQDPSTNCEDDHTSRELAGYAVKEATKADEMITSSQEQEALEESQDDEKEKITDGVFPERPLEVSGLSVLPLGDDECSVDKPNEDPKEAENVADTCEGDETTEIDIPEESDRSADASQADEPHRERLEKCVIEDPSTINNEGQLEQSELQKDWLATNTGPVSEGAATMLLNEGGLKQDDVQVELQKEDQGLKTDNLSESEACNDDKDVLVTISEEAFGGSKEDHDHLPNSSVEEDLEKTDYGLVPGGSEVVPLFDLDESEIKIAADEVENIGPIEIPPKKMGEMVLSNDVSRGGVQHVLAGADNQADEVDLTVPSETGSQTSLESETLRENERKLMEENEKLRDMMEKLLEAGKEQLSTISELSSKVNYLERRLTAKKKKQLRFKRRPKALHPQEIFV